MNTVYKYSYFSMSLTDRSLTCKPFLFLLSFIQVPIAFDLYELRLRKILLLCAKIFIFLLLNHSSHLIIYRTVQVCCHAT